MVEISNDTANTKEKYLRIEKSLLFPLNYAINKADYEFMTLGSHI